MSLTTDHGQRTTDVSLLVNRLGIEHALGDRLPGALVELAEEAALVTLVTRGAADLVHLEEHGVGIAVDIDILDLLHVAGLLALAPELAAATAEVNGSAGAHSFLERLAVHPCDHEHFAGLVVLRDRRHQPAGLVEVDVHSPLSADRLRVSGRRRPLTRKRHLNTESSCTPRMA